MWRLWSPWDKFWLPSIFKYRQITLVPISAPNSVPHSRGSWHASTDLDDLEHFCGVFCGVFLWHFFGVRLVSFLVSSSSKLCVTEEWGLWTPCSKSCGSSVKKRSRAIKIPKAGKHWETKRTTILKRRGMKGQRALSFFFESPKLESFECAKIMRHSENLEYCCHLVKQAWFVSSTLRLNSICQLCLDKNLAESTMYWGQGYPRRSRCQANGGKDCVGVADDERPVAMKVYLCTLREGKQQLISLKSGALLATELAIGSNLIQHWPCIVLTIRKKICSDVLSVAFCYSFCIRIRWSEEFAKNRSVPKTALSRSGQTGHHASPTAWANKPGRQSENETT